MTWPLDDSVADGALRLLRSAGFQVVAAELPELGPIAIAEDRYSIVGLLAAADWGEVRSRALELPIGLSNWAIEHGAGDRQWDVYLVVLLSERIDEGDLADVERFVSDTRFVRRIVRGSLAHGVDAIRAALAPFLPVDIRVDTEEGAPLEELEAKLRRTGLDEAVVAGAFDSFRATGEVEIP
jgi:hypothetical protein